MMSLMTLLSTSLSPMKRRIYTPRPRSWQANVDFSIACYTAHSQRHQRGDECFPFAYWASQDSIVEHRLTGYALTNQQWLNRVVKLTETFGDLIHFDSWPRPPPAALGD